MKKTYLGIAAAMLLLTACGNSASQNQGGSTAPAVNPAQSTAQSTAASKVEPVSEEIRYTFPEQNMPLPEELKTLTDDFMNALNAHDHEKILSLSNLDENVAWQAKRMTGEEAAEEKQNLLESTDETEFASYAVVFSAERKELPERLQREVAEWRTVLDGWIADDFTKQDAEKAIAAIDGVTEMWSVELQGTEADGDTSDGAFLLVKQNGKWKVDTFLSEEFRGLEASRKEIRRAARRAASMADQVLSIGLRRTREDSHISTDILEGKDFTWTQKTILLTEPPQGEQASDPIQNIAYYANYADSGFRRLQRVMFSASEGKCYACAVIDENGVIGAFPVRDEALEKCKTLEEAFAASKKQAAENAALEQNND